MMDYHEAIHCMKVMAEEEVCEECNYYYRCDHYKQADMVRIAISAMQELQLYKDTKLCLIPEDVYGNQCEELDRYKQIGTLEEVRDAVEKQKRKKPCASNRCYVCPHCGLVTSLKIKHNYCDACGQRISWEE